MYDIIKSTEHQIHPGILFIIWLSLISVAAKIVLVLLFRIDWFKIKWTMFLRNYKRKNKSHGRV